MNEELADRTIAILERWLKWGGGEKALLGDDTLDLIDELEMLKWPEE